MKKRKRIEAVIILVPEKVRRNSTIGHISPLGHGIYKIRIDETIPAKEQLWLTIHEFTHLAIDLFCTPSLPGEAISGSLGKSKEEDIADMTASYLIKKLSRYWVEE